MPEHPDVPREMTDAAIAQGRHSGLFVGQWEGEKLDRLRQHVSHMLAAAADVGREFRFRHFQTWENPNARR